MPLDRESFRAAVFQRDGHRCVICGAREGQLDAHHIVERKLFGAAENWGYFLDNGVTVCSAVCHMRCETTEISVEQVRGAAGISSIVLPACLRPGLIWDKWGNEIIPDADPSGLAGMRRPGPLAQDEGCRRALQRGGLFWTLLPMLPE